MIGRQVIRAADGEVFTVTGQDHEGGLVLSPVVFGSPIAVSSVELIEHFDVAPDEVVVPPTEIDVQNALAAEAHAVSLATIARQHEIQLEGKPPSRYVKNSPAEFFASLTEEN